MSQQSKKGMDLVKYPDQEFKQSLLELSDSYKKLVVTKENLSDGRKALAKIREKRYDIQNVRDKNNSKLNEFKRKNKNKAEEFLSIIREVETDVSEKVYSVEAEIEADRERKRLERERVKKEQSEAAAKINEYSGRILECNDVLSVENIIKEIMAIKIFKKNYGESYDLANENKDKVLAQAVNYKLKLKEIDEEKAKSKDLAMKVHDQAAPEESTTNSPNVNEKIQKNDKLDQEESSKQPGAKIMSNNDSNKDTGEEEKKQQAISVPVFMKPISHFDTLDGGNTFITGIKELKFHCTLDENFQPEKFYITWLDGNVEEVKPYMLHNE